MAARLLYVLSPAKTLDMARSAVSKCSEPALLADAHALVRPFLLSFPSLARRLRLTHSLYAPSHTALANRQVKQLQELSQAKVKALLGVSDALAKLNYQRCVLASGLLIKCIDVRPNACAHRPALTQRTIHSCRFQDFEVTSDGKPQVKIASSELKKQAALTFNGPAYQGE